MPRYRRGPRPTAAQYVEIVNTTTTQSSQLLPELFRRLDDERRLSVLHIGPPFHDTLEFFSGRRCRLQIVDLFAELPLPALEETDHGLTEHLRATLHLPQGIRFDVCLFWDLFNYLDAAAVTALLDVLAPTIGPDTLAHGFSVHNARTPDEGNLYGIHGPGTVSVRAREQAPPGYAPHSQRKLVELLYCFTLERTVLLADRRLELLLQGRPREAGQLAARRAG